MTFVELAEIIKINNIPEDVKLMSDSGWECNETEMNGIWYNVELNTIVFTQGIYMCCDNWYYEDGWVLLHGDLKEDFLED